MSESGRITSLGTVGAFLNGRACSDTLFHVLNRAFDRPIKPEESAAMPFAGGIMQHGYQCGMIWGAALAAGAQAYRHYGAGPLAETMAIMVSQRLVESFRTLNTHINCLEITDIGKSSTAWQMINYFVIKGGTIRCFRMAARYAPAAFSEINAAFSEKNIEVPSSPVSCAAMLAQKAGLSEIHTLMVAGFAGGIGLCGGACGALGAAIWIIGMKGQEQGGKIEFKSRGAAAAIDKFLRCSNFEFECEKITGRKFENAGDHARYLCEGGCSHIIEELARVVV